MIDLTRITSEICEEEGYKGLLYDDKTGKTLQKGDVIQGNPTIGNGWNVIAKAISKERSDIITSWFVQDAYDDLQKTLPWVLDHPLEVQEALVDLTYNLGVEKLQTFNTFLGLVQAKKYKEAGEDLDKTLWAKQVGPNRSHDVEELIKESK